MEKTVKKAEETTKGSWFKPKNLFDKVFEYGILIKGIDGLIELFTAIALIFLSPSRLQGLVVLATHRELAHDPDDFISNFLIHTSQQFTNSARLFFIVYLAVHAAIKIVSVIGLLRNQMWAYPFSLISLGALTLYQIYDIIFGAGSIFVILLTVFDLGILALIWREYQKVKLTRAATDTQLAKD
ncbi:MAG: hypothetical protein JWN12_840 [Candidatus Saccharibacteria bacterium]|nr:hypothetical protein [Candidatus Saccharibacteria bacterium]